MAETNVAQDQIKAYVDRILRMKDEADAIASDVKEIYAEAKANGFDKTQLGNLVTYLRKKDKDADKVAEGEAIFDLYLTAYMGAAGKVGTKRATHAHAHEDDVVISDTIDRDGNRLKVTVDSRVAAVLAHSTEPQPTKAAGSDLADPKPLGQVATHSQAKASEDGGANVTGESAPDDSVTGDASRASDGAGTVAPIPDADKSVEAPASAAPARPYAAPGVVTWESAPPEGVIHHPYSRAFGTLGQDIAVIEDDLRNLAAEPIVKVGNMIIDGWARFNKARGMFTEELRDGVVVRMPIEYQVVQYAGTDPLMDVIRWNMNGRILNESQRRQIAKNLVGIESHRKADIFKALDMGMELVS